VNVNEVLKRFRQAEYHYPDIIWHDIRSLKLKPKLTAKLVNMTADEFKILLGSNLFLPKSVSPQRADVIITENDFNEVKLKMLDLFLGVKPLSERLQAALNLEGLDTCIVSQLLAAINNN
jgi:hypothetical protein